MSQIPISISAASRLATVAFALVTAFAILPVHAQESAVQTSTVTRAQINWVIQITEPSSGTKPEYKILNPSPLPKLQCPFSLFDPGQGPKTVRVCQGDTVQWSANTPGMQSELYIYHDDPIFDYKGGSPQGFHASNGDMTDPASIKLGDNLRGSHEYHLALFDKSTNHLYLEDPKIIIGGGSKAPRSPAGKYSK